ncbi:MAG: hypothetical protein GXY32_10055 [Ruminococcaceae bacterium]|nr:hypothetical protein [Oscillospiraceae bacterium]
MKLKKWIALALSAVLAVSLTGCIGNLYENVGTIDGTTVSSGLYLMYQYNAHSVAKSRVADQAQDMFGQEIEGKKTADWISDRTEDHLRRYVAVQRLAREHDVQLSSEAQDNINQTMQYWSYMEDAYKNNGISQNTYLRYMTNEETRKALFKELYKEDGEFGVPDAQLKEEYADANAHVQSYAFAYNGSAEGDKKDEITALAEEAAKALDGGADFEAVVAEYAEKAAEILGDAETFDAATATAAIKDEYIPYEAGSSTTYSDDFLAELKGQAVGDAGTYNLGTTLMLYQKMEPFASDEAFLEMRDTVVSELREDDFDAYLHTIYDDYAADWAMGARGYFNPKNVKG